MPPFLFYLINNLCQWVKFLENINTHFFIAYLIFMFRLCLLCMMFKRAINKTGNTFNTFKLFMKLKFRRN